MVNTAAVTMTYWRRLSLFSPGNNVRSQQQCSLLREPQFSVSLPKCTAERHVMQTGECAENMRVRLPVFFLCEMSYVLTLQSGMRRHIVWYTFINVSEERASSIFRVEHFLLNVGNCVPDNMESDHTALRIS
jgi:hypothetical protein